jgi:hypothetical protein
MKFKEVAESRPLERKATILEHKNISRSRFAKRRERTEESAVEELKGARLPLFCPNVWEPQFTAIQGNRNYKGVKKIESSRKGIYVKRAKASKKREEGLFGRTTEDGRTMRYVFCAMKLETEKTEGIDDLKGLTV